MISQDELTVKDMLSFSIFERGEIAALAGLELRDCPFHEKRDTRLRQIWFRGFIYGGEGA